MCHQLQWGDMEQRILTSARLRILRRSERRFGSCPLTQPSLAPPAPAAQFGPPMFMKEDLSSTLEDPRSLVKVKDYLIGTEGFRTFLDSTSPPGGLRPRRRRRPTGNRARLVHPRHHRRFCHRSKVGVGLRIKRIFDKMIQDSTILMIDSSGFSGQTGR